jgi:rubrerythrin
MSDLTLTQQRARGFKQRLRLPAIPMTYICRDCNYRVSSNMPVNKCPNCASLYLIPENYKKKIVIMEYTLPE